MDEWRVEGEKEAAILGDRVKKRQSRALKKDIEEAQAKIKALPPKRAELEDEVVMDPRLPDVQTYLGRTKPSWKFRRNGHTASFKHIGMRTDSGLSKYVWDLKGLKRGYTLSWSLIARSSSYSPSLDTCRLCLTEKHLLMQHPGLGTLNVEDEFYSACRHRDPLLLSKIK